MKALFSRRGSRSSHTNGGGGSSSSSSGGRFKGRRTATTDDGDDGNLYYTPPAPAAQTSADSDAGIGSVPPPVKSSSSSRLSRATSLGTISGLVAAASPTARKSTPPDFQRQLSAYSGTTDSNHDTRSTAAPSIRSSRSTSTNALSIGKSASRRLSTWTADTLAKRKQSRSHPPSSYHFDDENTTTTTLKTKRKDASDGSRSNTNTYEDLHPAVFVVSNPSVSVSPPTPRPRATSTMSSTNNDDSFTTPGDTQDGGSATNATTNTMQSSNEPDTTETAGTTYERTTADTLNRTLDVPGNGMARTTSNNSGLSKKNSTRSRRSKKDVSFEPAAAAPKAALAAPLSPSSLAKQLEELAISHGDGLLSDSEYRTLRQRLLERSVEANPSVDSAIESPGTLHFNNRLSVLDLEDREAAQREAAQEQNVQPPSPSRTSRTLPSMFKRASILGRPKVQRGSSAASTSGPPSSWSLRRSTSRLSINSAFSAASRSPGPLTDSQVPNGAVAAAAPTLAPSSASAMSSSSSTPRSLKPGAVQRMLSTRSAASSTRSISDDDRNGAATSSFGFGDGSGTGTGSGGGTTTGDRASSLAASSSRPSRRRLMSVASFQTTTSSERKAAEAINLERDVHSMRQARSLATSPAAKGLARARSRSLMQERERESNNGRRGSLEVERSGSRSRASSLRRTSQHQQQSSAESAPARVGEESSTSTMSAAALGFDDLDWQYSDKTAKEIQAEITIVEAEGKRVAAAFSDGNGNNGETNGGKGAGGADEAGRDAVAVAQRYEERLAFLRSKLRSAKIRESFAK